MISLSGSCCKSVNIAFLAFLAFLILVSIMGLVGKEGKKGKKTILYITSVILGEMLQKSNVAGQ